MITNKPQTFQATNNWRFASIFNFWITKLSWSHSICMLMTGMVFFQITPPSQSLPFSTLNTHAEARFLTSPRLSVSRTIGTSITRSSKQISSDENVETSNYDLSLFSPCKINLFLRILRKRPDNYHDLASLFQTVGFGDTLHVKLLTKQDEIDMNDGKAFQNDLFECNMDGVPTDDSNLVIRALNLMREKTENEDKVSSKLFYEHMVESFLISSS